MGGFSLKIGENRNMLKKKKIGKNMNWTPCTSLVL